MKKSLRHTASLLAIAASFSLAGMAQAQSTPSNTTPSYRAGGSYVELNAGQSDFSVGNGIGAWNSDEGDTAYSARVGNYFNENLGFEIGYNDFGSINRGGGSTRARGINLSLVGKLPLSRAFNLLGKIGTTYSDTDTSAQLASGIPTGSANGFGVSYGIGAEYAFTPQWSAVLQYESNDVKFAGDRNDRVDVTTMGVRYRY